MAKSFLPPEWNNAKQASEPSEPADVEIEVTEDATVEDTEDGGALITLDDDSERQGSDEFMSNLAEDLSDNERMIIASDLLELIEKDKKSREKRDQQYEEGLRRTGLGEDAPGGAQFEGASKVVHPILAESCVDFSARIMKEMFPPNGPVREKIIGKPTSKKIQRANRKRDHMNWQLTEQITEYRREMEQAMTQVPLGGSQYLKWYWDEGKLRPAVEFVPIDNLYLPFACTGLQTASRITQKMDLDAHEYESRIEQGLYIDLEAAAPADEPEESKSQRANDKIEGKQSQGYNEDGVRTVYEVHCWWKLDGDEKKLPYIITIDEAESDVLSIYRNWDEADETQQRLEWFVELPFIPWRGAYCIGLPHLIGGISAALTGALRALLDSAHIANFPGALKLKGARISGGNNNIDPTQVLEVEAPPGTTDIRQIMMPLTLANPSPVLLQLLGWLSDAAKGVVSTAEEKLADATNNGPVGTTQALIEQGSVVFSSIHARMHNAQKQSLAILHRLNATYLTEEIRFGDDDEDEDVFVKPEDYQGPMDVIPVSDPNIFSETQRFSQIQAVSQRATAMPQLYNLRKVEERILDTLKIPNAESLLIEVPEPKPMNAVNENMAMVMGKPVLAFPMQDHEAHLMTHLDFLKSPAFGSSLLAAPVFIPACLEHVKQHITFWYAHGVYNMTQASTGVAPESLMSADPEVSAQLDRLLAMASSEVVAAGEMRSQELTPLIMQAIQTLQQLQPQNPTDPNQTMAEAAVADVKRKSMQDQAMAAAKIEELRQKRDNDVAKLQMQMASDKLAAEQKSGEEQLVAMQKLLEMAQQVQDLQTKYESDMREAELQARTQLAINSQDNETALRIARMRTEAGGPGRMINGNTITNPTPGAM
jgi:hypothetical protein